MSKAVKKKAPKKRANGYKMPERIPLGEIITDLSKKKWIIGPSIGVGGFGEIYSASEYTESSKTKKYQYVIKIEPRENGPLFVENNFYMRNAKAEDISNWMKLNKIKSLGMPKYIGSGTHECNGLKYRFLVMERFERDIWNIFLENGHSFPELTVFQIGYQILNVLEYIHSKGYVHADIKGANILLNSELNVFLVDFGLASHFSTKEFKNDPKKAHNGTIEYTSRDAHNGVPTRRGDLEILAYNMLHWLGNSLPWEKLTDVKVVQQEKEKFMSNIPQVLKTKFLNVPDQLIKFFQYIVLLKYDTEPDYNKCRTILLDGIKKAGGSLNSSLNFLIKSQKTPTQKKATPKITKSPPKRFKKSLSPTEIENELNSSDEESKPIQVISNKYNINKKSSNESYVSNSPDIILGTPPSREIKKVKKSQASPNKTGRVLKKKITKKSTPVEKENLKTTTKRVVRNQKVINYNENVSSPEVSNVNIKLGSKRTSKTSSDEASPIKMKKKNTTKVKTESSWKNFPTVINCNVEKPGEYKKKSAKK